MDNWVADVMDRRRTNTRERMVRAALDLFRERGFHGTGFTDVLEATGAARGAIYHHFPDGKDELAAAVIEANGRDVHDFLQHLLRTHRPDEALRRFISWYADRLDETELAFGCPMAPTVLEAGLRSEAVTQAATQAIASWSDPFADAMRQHGVPARRARQVAETVIAGFEGALILVRARRDVRALRTIGGELVRLVDAAIEDS